MGRLVKIKKEGFIPDPSILDILYTDLISEKYTVYKGAKLVRVETNDLKWDLGSTKTFPAEDYINFWGKNLVSDNKIEKVSQPFINYTGLYEEVNSFEDFKSFDKEVNEFKRERFIETVHRTEDKITISSRYAFFIKKYGKKYYTDESFKRSITLNIKTGNIYFIYIGINRGKATKIIKKNQFKGFNANKANSFKHETSEFLKNYLSSLYDLPISNSLNDTLLLWFLRFHGIKVNNNFKNNFINFYPTLKLLRKKDMNLTNSLMHRFKINGDKIKRVINTNDNLDFLSLSFYFNLFGIDFFNKIPDEVIVKLCTFSEYEHYPSEFIEKNIRDQYDHLNSLNFSKSELNKVYNIINSLSKHQIIDHGIFRNTIYAISGNRLKFNFRNYKEFQEEHSIFEKTLRELKKDSMINLSYEKDFINFIEQPILLKEVEYQVSLLKNTKEYIEEGLFQSHCVAGYIDRSSHIISIRKDNIRCTVEINENGIRSQNQMTKGRSVDGNWLRIIEDLDLRIKESRNKRLFPKKKVIQHVSSNGMVLEDAYFPQHYLPF